MKSPGSWKFIAVASTFMPMIECEVWTMLVFNKNGHDITTGTVPTMILAVDLITISYPSF